MKYPITQSTDCAFCDRDVPTTLSRDGRLICADCRKARRDQPKFEPRGKKRGRR